MNIQEQIKGNNKIGELFGNLFLIRNQIHLNHLKITGNGSYAGHIALNEFYDQLVDMIDGLIESYQGKYGIIQITIPNHTNMDSIMILEKLASLTDDGSYHRIFKDTYLQNQIDELTTLTYKTLYKLKNLK